MNLNNLVEQSAIGVMPAYPKIKIINDVHSGLRINTCRESMNSLLYGLLQSSANHAASQYIRVVAKAFHNIILLQIKYQDLRHEAAIKKEFEAISRQAERLGGCIYISNSTSNETTLSLTFPGSRPAGVS